MSTCGISAIYSGLPNPTVDRCGRPSVVAHQYVLFAISSHGIPIMWVRIALCLRLIGNYVRSSPPHYIKPELATLWHPVCKCVYMTLNHLCGPLHLNACIKGSLFTLHVMPWFERVWSGMDQWGHTRTNHHWLWCANFAVSNLFWKDHCLVHLEWTREGSKQLQIEKCSKLSTMTKALF